MQKFNILLFDYPTANAATVKALSERYNLYVFNFINELNYLMHDATNKLSPALKGCIDRGEVIPTHLLEEVLKSKIAEAGNQDVLFVKFPKTVEQFLMLEKVLGSTIHTIWHVKQGGYEKHLKQHFKNPNEKLWLEKYGDEVIDKWKDDAEKQGLFISELKKLSAAAIWKIIEVDDETALDEQQLPTKINATGIEDTPR